MQKVGCAMELKRKKLAKYLSSRIVSQSYVSSAITASVITLVLLIVLQENPPNALESIVIIAWTVICINTLRIFSQMVGKSIEKKRKVSREEKLSYLKEFGDMIVQLTPIIILFILSYIGLFPINTAYKLSIIIILSLLFTYGFAIIRFWTSNLILCILGGIGFVLFALSLVLMRMLIN